jgi:His/Glu/Gln/Arg/opine family amino acid ABC transporter permease subunit
MDFDFSPILVNWRFLGGGLLVTVLLSVSTIVCATIVGTGIGLGRTYGSRWLRIPLTFYVDSMRALPILVILVWIFFAFPIAFGVLLPPFYAALLALTLHISAYVSEIVRAGVVSVRFGQTRAGLALGMSRAQIIRKIILPQAIVRILPPYGSILSITIKETAVATVIAVPEYMHQSETIASQSLRPIEVFTTAMIVYFILLFPVTRGVDFVYRRIAHLGRS